MKTDASRETCTALNERFQKAESEVRSALATIDSGHPLTEPARELLAIHTEIRDVLLDDSAKTEAPSPGADPPEVAQAAIQIEREAHTLKADFMDVLKALFMWKDDPVERAQSSSQ